MPGYIKFHDLAIPDDWVPVAKGTDLPQRTVALFVKTAGTLIATLHGSGGVNRDLGAMTAETVITGRFKVVDAASTGEFLAGIFV